MTRPSMTKDEHEVKGVPGTCGHSRWSVSRTCRPNGTVPRRPPAARRVGGGGGIEAGPRGPVSEVECLLDQAVNLSRVLLGRRGGESNALPGFEPCGPTTRTCRYRAALTAPIALMGIMQWRPDVRHRRAGSDGTLGRVLRIIEGRRRRGQSQ